MRSLRKEKRAVYVSKKLQPTPVLDENGHETGEYYSVYDKPMKLFLNVKPITDIAEQEAFGADVSSILKAIYTPYDISDAEISEFDAVWIETEPNSNLKDDDPKSPMNNNYFVHKVLDTGNQVCAYFKKVTGRSNEG